MVLRGLGILVGAVVLIVVVFAALHYYPSKPVAELRALYTYPTDEPGASQFVTIEGMDVHYRELGEGHPLLLLHGTGASLHTWETWSERMQDTFRVVSLDLPAYGLTGPHPEGDYSVAMYLRLLDALAEHLGIDSCFIAGNSFGGMIAWEYAHHRPERVRKLILVNASGLPREQPNSSLGIRLARNAYTAPILHRITPRFLYRKSLEEVYHNDELVTDRLVQQYHDFTLREGNRRAFTDRVQQPYEDRSYLVADIQQPTLVMWGSHDTWIPPLYGHRFDSLLPHSTLLLYENTGHIPMEERPIQSAVDARAFLLGEMAMDSMIVRIYGE